MSELWLKAVGFAGSAYVVQWIFFTLFRILYPYKLAAPKNLKKLAGAEWAVVTGSTDGIGKAYAIELAKRGFKLILVARNEEKLKSVAAEIQGIHSTEIRTIVFDFTCTDVSTYEEQLLEHLREVEVGVLGKCLNSINNVGCSYDFPERMDQVGLELLSKVCITNTLPVVLMSSFLLGQMAKRRSGIVINLSSSAALQYVYNWAGYSASKKFVMWLSQVLRKEFAGTGITIQTVVPMMVATKMSRLRRSLLVPNAEDFAREALNSVGHVNETTGFFWHEIQITYLFKICPDWFFDIVARRNAKFVKQKALQKRNSIKTQ
ncbi:17beta-hydroxysteroid dehydrogenase [Aphelenchoides bicaudatus]|nr:17beta-hydroxysteroid dehydrogenase [Aphelenchoides bicaudatus]